MERTVMQRITKQDKDRLAEIAAYVEDTTGQNTNNVDVLHVLIDREYKRLAKQLRPVVGQGEQS